MAAAAGLALVVIVVVILATRPASKTPGDSLTRTFNGSPTGFAFRYPADWTYVIPMQGFLVTGTAATLNENQPGATFTVQRGEPLSIFGTLDAALDLYLKRGPMRPDRSWTQLGEITSTTLLGRAALAVDLQGKENSASPELHAHLVITTAQNTFVYTFILTAPSDQWAVEQPRLQAMLESVQILE